MGSSRKNRGQGPRAFECGRSWSWSWRLRQMRCLHTAGSNWVLSGRDSWKSWLQSWSCCSKLFLFHTTCSSGSWPLLRWFWRWRSDAVPSPVYMRSLEWGYTWTGCWLYDAVSIIQFNFVYSIWFNRPSSETDKRGGFSFVCCLFAKFVLSLRMEKALGKVCGFDRLALWQLSW